MYFPVVVDKGYDLQVGRALRPGVLKWKVIAAQLVGGVAGN